MKPAGESALLTSVLKDVSRSFYLSLRILPAPMRRAAGIGYLLARASDTIADTSAVGVARRIECLERYGDVLVGREMWTADDAIRAHCTMGERVLMDRVEELFELLFRLPEGERVLVQEVVKVIISGQKLDLTRLSEEGGMRIEDDEELWDYCDRVAGCVGVFWTKLGYLTLGDAFSGESEEQMTIAGRSLGRGLQLVNILRDLPEDIRYGRFYLPRTRGLPKVELMVSVATWLKKARSCVADGMIYARHIRDRRARMASVLPVLIAEDTIELLEQASWDELAKRVKVKKFQVFRAMFEAFLYR